MIWNCGNCGAEIDEGTQFCPKCGTKINWETPQTDQTFTCGNCGGEFKGRVEYCPHCGTNINWESTNNNQDEMSTLEGFMYFFGFFIPLGVAIVGIAEGHWILGCIVGVVALSVSAGVIYYAGKKIPMKIAAAVVIFIGLVESGLFINTLGNYKQKEKIEQRKQEAERKAQEQKEAEAERKEREKKEEAEREEREKQDKIKRVADMAYQKGYQCRRETWGDYNPSSESRARLEYTMRYGREPEEEGQSERWNVFKENYMKGFRDAADEIMKRKRQEDF